MLLTVLFFYCIFYNGNLKSFTFAARHIHLGRPFSSHEGKPQPGQGRALGSDQETIHDQVEQVPARREFIKARVEANVRHVTVQRRKTERRKVH